MPGGAFDTFPEYAVLETKLAGTLFYGGVSLCLVTELLRHREAGYRWCRFPALPIGYVCFPWSQMLPCVPDTKRTNVAII